MDLFDDRVTVAGVMWGFDEITVHKYSFTNHASCLCDYRPFRFLFQIHLPRLSPTSKNVPAKSLLAHNKIIASTSNLFQADLAAGTTGRSKRRNRWRLPLSSHNVRRHPHVLHR